MNMIVSMQSLMKSRHNNDDDGEADCIVLFSVSGGVPMAFSPTEAPVYVSEHCYLYLIN